MSILPKIEKITRDATISHFFLMFGFRMFSLYFPLFLVNKGFSLPQVGWTYLLIYLPIAIFAPVVGFLNHKVNPARLAALGALGYGIYSLGMILFSNVLTFYFLQAMLGISAALFFVSAKSMLISARLEIPDRAFGWFYSAPYYASTLAPALGALVIWKFGFSGVFILSLAIQTFTAVFVFWRLGLRRIKPLENHFRFSLFQESYKKAFLKLADRKMAIFILVFFSVIMLGSFYQLYFVLFLKNSLFWTQNLILIFVSVFSFLFSPLSLFLIKRLEKFKSEKNILQGGLVAGLFSILFGAIAPVLNFFSALIINLFRAGGEFVADSSRSGLVSKKLQAQPEEASAIDTIFSPLGTALAALIAGLVIGFLGYQKLFIFAGAFVVFVILIFWRFAKNS